MAQFNADIKLSADAQAVERAIDRLEQRLERLRNKAASVMDGGSKGQNLLPPAALTRAEKFDKIVGSFYKKLGQLGSAFANAFAPLAIASGLFDKHLGSLNEELNVVSELNKRLNLMVDSTSKLDGRLRGVQRAWSKITYDFDVYNALAKKQVELEDRRSEILRRQANAIRRQRLEQEGLYEAVRRNVRRSEAGRQDSGFAAFSQEAGGAVRRRVQEDKQIQIDAINDVERLRAAKSVNRYNTLRRRARYLAKLQEDLDRKLEASRDKRRARRVRAEEQAAKDAARGLENLFLGAGFPLLFGGGAGAVGGGVLGSLFGDGFGGQVFVGAIGQQIDALAQSSIEFARAFREGGDAAGALAQALGYLNPEVSALISNLQRSGQTARAAAVAQGELAKVVGTDGARALRETGEDLDQYQRSIKQLGLQFLAAAQSASRFFQSLRGDFGRIPGLAPRVEEPDVSQAARDRENALARSNTLLEAEVQLAGISQKLEFEKYTAQLKRIANLELINETERIKIALDRGEITLAERKLYLDAARLKNDKELLRIKKLISENNARTGASDDKAAAAEQKRIATLQAQLNTATALLAIDKQIAAAKVDGDKSKLAELEYTRALEASELKIAEIRARRAGEAETQLQIQLEENRLEKQLLDIDTKRALERKKLEESFAKTVEGLQLELAAAKAVTVEEQKRLAIEKERLALKGKDLSEDQVNQIIQLRTQIQQAQEPIAQYITQTQRWLSDTQGMIVSLTQSIQTSISGAMAGAVEAMVTGSKTIQEVLSEMFAQIGRAFINMAAEIIAQQLVMIALQGVLKALGGNSKMDLSGTDTFNVPVNQMPAGMQFAEGGYVTGPTNAIVGEGGQSEYIIPSSKMSGAMARWNAGVRGEDVIDGPGGAPGGGGGSGGVPTFHLETTMINNVEYATVDQVRQMGSVATQRGAVLGETRTLRKLQMSGSTRRKLNI